MDTYICLYMHVYPFFSVYLQPNFSVNLSSDSDLKWIRSNGSNGSSLFSPFGAPFVQFLLFYNPIMTGHRLLSAPACLFFACLQFHCTMSQIYSFVRVLHFLCLFFCPCLFLFLSSVFNPTSCFLRRFSKCYTDLPENPCRVSFSHNNLGNSSC